VNPRILLVDAELSCLARQRSERVAVASTEDIGERVNW
jgi:hypothetical protein